MGIKLKRHGNRFLIETDEERKILECARSYFGNSKRLLDEGCGYRASTRAAGGRFSGLMNGKYSITPENWERIQEYASRFSKGKNYEPRNFVMPS